MKVVQRCLTSVYHLLAGLFSGSFQLYDFVSSVTAIRIGIWFLFASYSPIFVQSKIYTVMTNFMSLRAWGLTALLVGINRLAGMFSKNKSQGISSCFISTMFWAFLSWQF